MSGAGRPRTPVGTFGSITSRKVGHRYVASTRYRDWDGQLRKIEASGATKQAAERLVKERIATRSESEGATGEVSADTRFRELVKFWLQDIELEGRLAPSTRSLYERDMRTLVEPSFADLALREITVSRVDRFLKKQAQVSYARAKHAKVVLGLAMGLAVRYDAIPRNPVQATAPASSSPDRTYRSHRSADPADPRGGGLLAHGYRAVWPEAGRTIGPNHRGHVGDFRTYRRGTRAEKVRRRHRGSTAYCANLRHDRQPEGPTHSSSGPNEDGCLKPSSGAAVVHCRSDPAAAGDGER